MAIETTKQPSGSAPGVSNPTPHGKAAKPSAADASPDAAGGFASLLSALDEASAPLVSDAVAQASPDPQALAAPIQPATVDSAMPPDASAQGVSVMLSQSMLLAGARADCPPADRDAVPQAVSPQGDPQPVLPTRVESAATAPVGAESPAPAQVARAPAATPPGRQAGKVEPAGLSTQGTAAQPPDPAKLAVDPTREPLDHPALRPNMASSQSGKEDRAINSVANQLVQDARLAQHASRDAGLASLGASLLTPQLAGVTEAIMKKSERTLEAQTRYLGADSPLAPQGHLAAARMDAAAPVAEASAAFPTMLSVAEQVSYWAGKDIQNAELRLDGVGSSAVEVSVSVQGNEAHVSFRAEQLETRQALEGAAGQLKDLLQREGLVLSGMSVGTSGADASAQQQGRDRPRPQQATVVLPELAALDAGARPQTATGRALDLFV